MYIFCMSNYLFAPLHCCTHCGIFVDLSYFMETKLYIICMPMLMVSSLYPSIRSHQDDPPFHFTQTLPFTKRWQRDPTVCRGTLGKAYGRQGRQRDHRLVDPREGSGIWGRQMDSTQDRVTFGKADGPRECRGT